VDGSFCWEDLKRVFALANVLDFHSVTFSTADEKLIAALAADGVDEDRLCSTR